ncbi:MAG: Restriction endonuclease subunit S [Limosilactobacillus fermentum]|jgi:type I restriction enzyme, S subunit
MSKSKKRLVPVRRFKEFENADAWEQRKLGEVAEIKTGSRNHQDSVDNGKYPFFVRSEKVERLNEYDFDTKAILVPGDGRIGEIFHYYDGKFALHQRVYKVDNFKEVNPLYLLNLFKYKFKKHALRLNAQGTVPSLRLPMFTNWNILIPNLNEQQKIGLFFQQLDSLIALHQRKLDKLKRVKSAYLTEMFPAEGEREPKRRFPGFTGAWEQRRLGEVAKITMGQSPSSRNYTENPSDYILVQGNADMKNGHVVPRVWTTQITKQAEKGDLILSVRAPVGDIGKTDYDIVIGRGVAAIKGNSFIFQLLTKMKLNGYWTRFSTGSTFESINSDNIKNAQIMIPNLKEQEKIGNTFSSIDSLITLHQRKLDKLKKMKAAYLNEMFV